MEDFKNREKPCTGPCPDLRCTGQLIFIKYEDIAQCTGCHKYYNRNDLLAAKVISLSTHNKNQDFAEKVVATNENYKKVGKIVKVGRLSNYHCKLISSFLTHYGMDKRTGKPTLLGNLNQPDTFDCSVLGSRSFCIHPDQIDIIGYGRDCSGSAHYLQGTLDEIKSHNDNEEMIVPVHVDGDGHCLVHAVSKALVGRELFWHPLRINLKSHFEKNLASYKIMFKEFISDEEWDLILSECAPDFVPPADEVLGLRHIHIFGLANVLKRPIILLDSLTGMHSFGDYSALFLPVFAKPSECADKDGKLKTPICIAWSSLARNHYIPLVGIQNAGPPILPASLVPKVWGADEVLKHRYIEFNEGCCVIGEGRNLPDAYISQLAVAMSEVFMLHHNIHPEVVANFQHYLYTLANSTFAEIEKMISDCRQFVDEGKLLECLECDVLRETKMITKYMQSGGFLYKQAIENYGTPTSTKLYAFRCCGMVCKYDPVSDEFIPQVPKTDQVRSFYHFCSNCTKYSLRRVNHDGSLLYLNGDLMKLRADSIDQEAKYYWDGGKYDNLPRIIKVSFEWKNKRINESLAWFENQRDPHRNSNAHNLASRVIRKHFKEAIEYQALTWTIVDAIYKSVISVDSNSNELPSSRIFRLYPAARDVPPMSVTSEVNKNENTKNVLKGKSTMNKATVAKANNEDLSQLFEKSTIETESNETGSTDGSPESKCSGYSKPEESDEKLKIIKITTSSGKQIQLKVKSDLTFSALKENIESELSIPKSNQSFKSGFPPKILECIDDDDEIIPVEHGDRILVENLVKPTCKNNEGASAYFSLEGENSDDEFLNAAREMVDDILKDDNGTEISLSSLLLTDSFRGMDFWNLIRNMTSLYGPGGYFYELIKRQHGLEDGRCYKLPLLDDKLLTYNARTDRLEFYSNTSERFSESGGQDQIGKVQQVRDLEVAKALSTGSSSIAVNRNLKMPSKTILFQGTGHSLRENPCSSEDEGATNENHCAVSNNSRAEVGAYPKKSNQQRPHFDWK